ncbi:hypothetical protein WM40_04965 [Robbsia andropogonis]|uniref:Lipoprotein n=2 Tax=Robbsia andropogonis TaxID=28092 RepID=A0A0F5K469_9BURK|nr:hypothetical protein [Robbsia andropogonis]KKB64730.1 hypothetical protein WM40_04965 [Robbsia andropogonis]MCP1117943.1 YjbF family lipoprotein [Robbsia andropogonis]MCP1127408.1 YjbF family lipoprotein [Robbsia andropogonis]
MQIARLLVCATVLLGACSAPVTAVSDYIKFKRSSSQASVARTPLTKGYAYLLVTVQGKSFLMARGAQESAPGGTVDVWYSGAGEVLRLQNGRVLAASGTPVEWTDVRLSAQPDWQSIGADATLQRRRDESPGYHFGLMDQLTVTPIAAPHRSGFYGVPDPSLHWFRETSSGENALPASRYAVRFDGQTSEVVYGEQCLSRSLCFSWQRWPN